MNQKLIVVHRHSTHQVAVKYRGQICSSVPGSLHCIITSESTRKIQRAIQTVLSVWSSQLGLAPQPWTGTNFIRHVKGYSQLSVPGVAVSRNEAGSGDP